MSSAIFSRRTAQIERDDARAAAMPSHADEVALNGEIVRSDARAREKSGTFSKKTSAVLPAVVSCVLNRAGRKTSTPYEATRLSTRSRLSSRSLGERTTSNGHADRLTDRRTNRPTDRPRMFR